MGARCGCQRIIIPTTCTVVHKIETGIAGSMCMRTHTHTPLDNGLWLEITLIAGTRKCLHDIAGNVGIFGLNALMGDFDIGMVDVLCLNRVTHLHDAENYGIPPRKSLGEVSVLSQSLT
jgi:hypothetical protein